MSVQRDEDVNVVLKNSITQIREYSEATSSLFDELKLAAKFLVDVGDRLGLSNAQIEELNEKIDNLFLTLNESLLMKSGRIISELEQNADKTSYINKSELSISQAIPYEELYTKYNEALNKNVELTASLIELSNRFNLLQEALREEREKNAALEEAKQMLEQESRDKENRENRQVNDVDKALNSSLAHLNSHELKAKTAEDFVEVFEKVFKGADEIVQLIKQMGPTSPIQVAALDKSRMMRQVIHDVLAVFRKARLNPSVLGKDVSVQIAEELKRIYETLKSVKVTTEQCSSVIRKD